MKLDAVSLSLLGARLLAERKRQHLSREQAAAVCNVSASFIRDAESDPGKCSLSRLMLLVQGLGLTLTVDGWQVPDNVPQAVVTPPTGTAPSQ